MKTIISKIYQVVRWVLLVILIGFMLYFAYQIYDFFHDDETPEMREVRLQKEKERLDTIHLQYEGLEICGNVEDFACNLEYKGYRSYDSIHQFKNDLMVLTYNGFDVYLNYIPDTKEIWGVELFTIGETPKVFDFAKEQMEAYAKKNPDSKWKDITDDFPLSTKVWSLPIKVNGRLIGGMAVGILDLKNDTSELKVLFLDSVGRDKINEYQERQNESQ